MSIVESFTNISKKHQQYLKLQQLRMMLNKRLPDFFYKLYDAQNAEGWSKVSSDLQKKHFDEVFENQFTQNKENKKSKKVQKYSVNDLDESQLITLIEETYRKNEIPEYNSLPLAMEKCKEIRNLLVHDNLDDKQQKLIWDGFEYIFSFLGVKNASEDIRAIRDRELKIIPHK